jgi:GT2 family glycosyltransferase
MDLCRLYKAISVEDTGKSLAEARNKGVERARGSLIAFIDDDCEIPDTWLEKICAIFQQHPVVSCLGGPDLIPPDGERSVVAASVAAFDESRRTKIALDRAAVNKIKGANVTCKKEVFESIRYNTWARLCEDLDFHIRLVENGYHLRFDPENFLWHRQNVGRGGLLYGLGHILRCSIKTAPIFASWRTFTYAKDDSLITSFYLSLFLLPVMIVLLFVSSLAFCLALFSLMVIYTAFTVWTTKISNISTVCSIPFLVTLTTATRLLGFCIGTVALIFRRYDRGQLA